MICIIPEESEAGAIILQALFSSEYLVWIEKLIVKIPFLIRKGIWIKYWDRAPINVAFARITPPLKFNSFISAEVSLFIQKFDTAIIIIRLEINGDIDGMKNSFFAFSDPKPIPISPEKNIIDWIDK